MTAHRSTAGSKPSVLQVHSFHRDGTGADRYHRDLIRLLVRQGHRVGTFASRHETNVPSEFERYFPEGSRTGIDDAPGPWRAVRDAGKFFFHVEARRRARAIREDFQPDIVHVHNLFHHLSPAVLAPLREGGSPLVMTLHDYKLICPNYSLYTQGRPCTACRGGRFHESVRRRCVRDSVAKSALCALESFVHWNTRMYLDGVDRFIAPSRFLRDRFVDFGYPGERIDVVPNFTDVPRDEGSDTGDFVLFAGRLVEAKGLRTLLGAWPRARRGRPFRLLVAGRGPLEEPCRRLVAREGISGVELVGSLGRDEIGRLMAGAIAVVVPSVWYEPFGLSVLEAQARGRCVVASRSGGIPEIVEDRETGLLVEPGDERALGEALDEVLSDKALRQRLGEAARTRALAEHGPDRHYDRLCETYAAALRGRRSSVATRAAATEHR